MSELKFYRCNICGNMELSLIDSGVTPVCCGQDMEALRPNTHDGDGEKHVPVIEATSNGISVKIGEKPHPMLAEHRIDWIAVGSGDRVQIKSLNVDEEAVANFDIKLGVHAIHAYAFCNIHGLWSAEA